MAEYSDYIQCTRYLVSRYCNPFVSLKRDWFHASITLIPAHDALCNYAVVTSRQRYSNQAATVVAVVEGDLVVVLTLKWNLYVYRKHCR